MKPVYRSPKDVDDCLLESREVESAYKALRLAIAHDPDDWRSHDNEMHQFLRTLRRETELLQDEILECEQETEWEHG